MSSDNAPRQLRVASGLVPVDLDAEDLRAEIEARQDAALQQALDRARDKAGRRDFEIGMIHLTEPFEVKGNHYVGAAISIAVEREKE